MLREKGRRFARSTLGHMHGAAKAHFQEAEVKAQRQAERAEAFVPPVEKAAPTVEQKLTKKRKHNETENSGKKNKKKRKEEGPDDDDKV